MLIILYLCPDNLPNMVENNQINERIGELLEHLEPITLEQMSGIKLMNRTDTKFVTNKGKLAQLLELAQGNCPPQPTPVPWSMLLRG